jgi:hypothetical protein
MSENSYQTTAIEATEHFDPATYPYETFGLAEELTDDTTLKCVGIRRVAKADRPLGSTGIRVFELTSNIEVKQGHKTVILKASPKKPLKVRGTLFPMCGKLKEAK